ncbi:MAG: hypothetical protein H2041_06655 [Phenylobacterium sp.]|jgi:hypothetical protein|uniref:hypothetical protein n=1 Tax=unclassified Phenylobacterium TaxID=2640670 RepID=UPI00086D0DE8|nr:MULTISPECIES: hypothetical protein [unclassified Phenylobacterium]MBA4793330.1 hypothetical protein [Phenylobacterium sp.]MCR5873075.1 hypothetical protein [Phenylobacterium sp. J426]ODT85544.1 MAG: hypothetical protein ABS78_20060 [Phenylobacterium sp. SCN 70-31]OHB38497.1 MAG: hypothetical protein A2882_06205 [Phenylobacterium sp. RIFCSPHIGHO2_01_FULL_70_10]
MEEKLVETFMEARVAETGRDRAYWLSRSWVDQHRRGAVAAAPIVVLPWEDAEGDKIHYPTAAPEFVQMLREAFGPDLTIAIPTRPEDYAELVLHSREWRLPKLLIGFVLVPLLVNLLSDKVAELLPGFEVGDTIEMDLIVEGENHRCLSVTYKGPPDAIPEVVLKQIERCGHYLTEAKGAARK